MSVAVQSPEPGIRLDRPARIALGWRLALVVVAAVVVLLALPAWVRTPLSLAAALVTVEALVRRLRGRGLLHGVLVAVGGAIVVLALLGLLLNVLPSGLTAGAWGVAVGLVEAAVLIVLALRPAVDVAAVTSEARPQQAIPVAALGWSVVVIAVLAAAVAWSAASFTTTHVAPLALAAKPSGDAIVVTVSAGREQGPFELDLVTSSGRTVLRRGITAGPDRSATTTVRLPAGTRGLVQLVPAGTSTASRELILDASSTTRSAEDTK